MSKSTFISLQLDVDAVTLVVEFQLPKLVQLRQILLWVLHHEPYTVIHTWRTLWDFTNKYYRSTPNSVNFINCYVTQDRIIITETIMTVSFLEHNKGFCSQRQRCLKRCCNGADVMSTRSTKLAKSIFIPASFTFFYYLPNQVSSVIGCIIQKHPQTDYKSNSCDFNISMFHFT